MKLDRISPSLSDPVATDFVERLRQLAARTPTKPAYTFLTDGEEEHVSLTYQELDVRARAIGQHLIDMGMAGERALLLFPPGLDFVATIYGCFYAGVVAVPAYPPRRNRNMARIQAIAKDANAKLAISVQDHVSRVERFVDDAPELKNLTWLASDKVSNAAAAEWVRPPALRSDSLAILQYTSGSTGTPKGVVLTHGNLIHNCQFITRSFGASADDTGMSWLPTYHDMGLVGGILNPMYIPCETVLMSPTAFLQKPVRWLQAITRHGVTITGGPNFAYDYCTKKISSEELEGLDLSSWSVAYNGAEPVRVATIQNFCRKFAASGFRPEAFYPCYGMAESTLMITGGTRNQRPVFQSFNGALLDEQKVAATETIDPNARHLVGCGMTPPDGSIVIADPHTREQCPADRIGEIWVASPSVGQGYFNKPRETEATFRTQLRGRCQPGDPYYLRTGDLGFWRDDQLYVTGRIKDLIIVRGVNRYPQDIERTVEQSDERLRTGAAAAFAVDMHGRDQLIIVSEVERIAENNWDEVIGAIRRNVTATHELPPDGVILIRAGSIPKTSSGKIQRHACRTGFLNETLMVVADWFAWKDAGYGPSHRAHGEHDHVSIGDARSARRRVHFPKEHSNSRSSVAATESTNRGADGKGSHENHLHINGNGNGNGSHGHGLNNDNGASDQLEECLTAVNEAVRQVAQDRAGELTTDTNVIELGLDSLERLEIANRLEDQFGGRFPDHVLREMETCGEVAVAVRDHLAINTHQNGRVAGIIPPSAYKFEEFPEYLELKQQMAKLEETGIPNPFFHTHESVTRDTTVIHGREYINFASYNYLGMSGHPAVTRTAAEALERFGTSCSASRIVSGEKPLHRELERGIAEFLGVEDAVTFVGGHATNETTIGHLCGYGDLVIHDTLAHNSILQGATLSGAKRRQFPHNDWRALNELLTDLRSQFRRVLIVIEGVYSMDGDYPDLAKFIDLKTRHKALLMVDEAHSIGTMGTTGRGLGEHAGIDPSRVDVWMGTLSKAFGSCGGYIAGKRPLVEFLKYTAPGFVYSVGLSPPNAAAALGALKTLRSDPGCVTRCRENAALFLRLARAAELDTGQSGDTPIVPIILGNSTRALWLSHQLFQQGINVQPIMYPAVPESQARLRFFITSEHTEEQIRRTIDEMVRSLPHLPALENLRFDTAATGLPQPKRGEPTRRKAEAVKKKQLRA